MVDKLPEGFEPYLRGKTRYSKRDPLISIQSKGTINFNAPAKTFLGDYVLLAYNPKTMQLALVPVNADDKGAYPVRQVGTSETYKVSGMGLFASYGIETDKIKGKYSVSEEGGMYIVPLGTDGGNS
jgi:hypothetical protein